MISSQSLHLFLGAILACLIVSPSRADSVHFEIKERVPFAGGREFGEVGAYEEITGRVHYELDPDLPHNQNVIDLKLAVRNERGLVECSSDLHILAPKNPGKGNGALLYDVNNRGNKLALRHFNNTAPGGGSEGFLMRHGFTIVSSGWDGELLPSETRLRLCAPVAKGKEKPITGLVRCEIVPSSDTNRTVINWANHGSYRPTPAGLQKATLTHRILAGHPRVPIPRKKLEINRHRNRKRLPRSTSQDRTRLPGRIQESPYLRADL